MAGKLYSVMFTGVGGQGVLVASDILAIAAMYAGYDVKKSEVHGMAQRGGSVESGVRFGNKVFSPLIGMGEADFLVAFEKLEALRALKYLRKGGTCLINDYEWMPLSVLTGEFTYHMMYWIRSKNMLKKLIYCRVWNWRNVPVTHVH